MRHLSKSAVVVGLGAFLLALLWWLPAVAYAGPANCPLQPGACIEEEAVYKKIARLGNAKKIVRLGALKFKVR